MERKRPPETWIPPWERPREKPVREQQPRSLERSVSFSVTIGEPLLRAHATLLDGACWGRCFLIKASRVSPDQGSGSSDRNWVTTARVLPPGAPPRPTAADPFYWSASLLVPTTDPVQTIGIIPSPNGRSITIATEIETAILVGCPSGPDPCWLWRPAKTLFEWQPTETNPSGCACSAHQPRLSDVGIEDRAVDCAPVVCFLTGCACVASPWCLWCATAFAGPYPSADASCCVCNRRPRPLPQQLFL